MRHIYLTILISLLITPSFAQGPEIDVHGFDRVYELEKLLTPIDIQGEIWQAHAMASDGSYIFVVNDKEVPPIKSYRLKDGKFMGGFGSVGGGPGEFVSINRSGFGVRKDKLIVQGRKYVRVYKPTAKGDKLDFQLEREVRIPGEVDILNNGFMLNEYELAGTAMFSPKHFVTFRLKRSEMGASKDVGAFGEYPNLHPETSVKAYHDLYRGDSDDSYDGRYLTKIYSSFPLIRVFDLSDGDYSDIHLLPKNEQIDKVVLDKRDNMANGLDRFYYQGNVEMSNDMIVTDYQERILKKVAMTSQGNLKSVPQTDRFLLVLTMEGELLAKLTPPEWFQRFIITPDNKMIAFHPEIENKLFSVDLNQFR